MNADKICQHGQRFALGDDRREQLTQRGIGGRHKCAVRTHHATRTGARHAAQGRGDEALRGRVKQIRPNIAGGQRAASRVEVTLRKAAPHVKDSATHDCLLIGMK